MKKSITELSDKELLDLVGNNPEQVTIYEWPTDVMEFISVYNLQTGNERITSKLLYRLYCLWSKNTVTRKTLTKTLTDLFPSSTDGKSVTILLNKSALNLKDEAYKYIKSLDKSKNKSYQQHFEKYLHEYCIKNGGLFIKDTVLYNLYDKWCYKKRNPLSFKQFNNLCKSYFKEKLIDKHYWYSVDESIKTYLTEDLINEMRKSVKKKKNSAIQF